MFGERYFTTRERLTAVMHGIAELAAETGADVTCLPDWAERQKGLGRPFLFVVCGEVNAGKSTLINGLLGHDLCRVNVLPETLKVQRYQHGHASRDVEKEPLFEEKHRNIDVLRAFHFVDTPGTNSSVKGHLPIIHRLFPHADLLLFVFPVSNPWGATTWDLISKLSPDELDKTAFVIQQADQRQAADLPVIIGHMRDLALKRTGHAPRTFAVSGKLACEIKRTRPGDIRALEESGFPALENFITETICGSTPRRRMLKEWQMQAALALEAVDARIEQMTGGLARQGRFLTDIEHEIHALREHFVHRLPRHLAEVAEVFESEANWVSKRLKSRLGIVRSIYRLFAGEQTSSSMETVFISRLHGAVVKVAEKDSQEVVSSCLGHWKELRKRVKEEMGVELDPNGPPLGVLESARSRFVARLGTAAREGVGNLHVRHQLTKDLRNRNISLKSFTFSTLLFLTAAGICGALHFDWAPYILCGVAGIFFIGCLFTITATKKTITADFRDRLLDACGTFANMLKTDYEEALRIVFQEYATSLGAVKQHLARESQAIEPKSKRWQELFLTLKAIEQEL